MEKISALLALFVGNSPVTGEFPSERPVMGSFDVFSDLLLNKRLSKQSWGWWFETNYAPVYVWEYVSDFVPRCTGNVINLPMPGLKLIHISNRSILIKRAPDIIKSNSDDLGVMKLSLLSDTHANKGHLKKQSCALLWLHDAWQIYHYPSGLPPWVFLPLAIWILDWTCYLRTTSCHV